MGRAAKDWLDRTRGASNDASGIWEAINFQAGDNLLIPRGAEVAWEGAHDLREYWVTFDSTDPAPTDSPAVIKLEHDGPPEIGLQLTSPKGPGPAKEYKYFSSATGASAGIWETEAAIREPNLQGGRYRFGAQRCRLHMEQWPGPQVLSDLRSRSATGSNWAGMAIRS